MIKNYQQEAEARSLQGIPPLPLNPEQTHELTELLEKPVIDTKKDFLLNLLKNRVPPGVDKASYIKATWLSSVAQGTVVSPYINSNESTRLLGTMMGGYNVSALIQLLSNKNKEIASIAAESLSNTLLIYDALNDVMELAESNNAFAKQIVQSWAEAEWFTSKAKLPKAITVTVFKVEGETNTDDLSPATHATTRPDIPLHALAMLETRVPEGLQTILSLKEKGHPLAYVGDVVGTGSSRKSAINSVLWHIGKDIPYVPNKRSGGIIIGGKIAPIFFNTAEDSGALPIECDVSQLATGDVITIFPYEGIITRADETNKEPLASFNLKPSTILDEVQAGGRIPLMIGRSLTDKVREKLKLPPSIVFIRPGKIENEGAIGFTQAQKIVGKACGLPGIKPGTNCEPIMTTVGSQDTTGPMTRDEMKELACLGFSADLVMQSFCHTAAYPKPVDIKTQKELPDFFAERGGVALKPGDGIIHSWLNRMLLPDTVGTGGDSHTRFPLGISFPGGSGIVAFAAAIGAMPLDMPESVLVQFKGNLQAGITLRDVVNAIPLIAIQKGLLTVGKENKINVFNGKIMEIEGLPNLKLEQAFELTDASAERSCAGCSIQLSQETISEYITSNISLLKNMIARGYKDARTLGRRITEMEKWLKEPNLIKADSNAVYSDTIDINLDELLEPVLACPNDPDNVKILSQVAGTPIQEVFIGSCMTNIGHYRAAAKILENAGMINARLWICPPTRMDEEVLKEEGYYKIFEDAGSRMEMPGCSLCMGNQARVEDNTTVFSTSTRNFNNRLGKGAQVFLGSAELAAVCALLGRIPTVIEYKEIAATKINPLSETLYKYLNFNEIKDFEQKGQIISLEVQKEFLNSTVQ
ncbi:bifunctional aconitate hydratase 2/2-methylisocitrate dehydratase [Prochlorococcus marinus]|uniref:bifunctional aconitate hydratase 2/2-methylisocitrate dehydratase n=1 Tax=Prochlorococcus marinus TaxID=1219 RepID=UPI0022B2B646|nr:bifunctional aconitate hydratase 2/2-methylisocitrate dehydratase [Prochlorococcus marinus]